MDSCAERADPGDSEQDEEEDVYEVERIIDMRVEDGEILYRVRWKNYSSDDDTWEPKAHLEDCSEVLLAYERSLAEKKLKKDPSMKLPMKSELFDANSESDSDKDKLKESPSKKKKKKKKHVEDSEDEKSEKDKKKKKKKEKWKEDKPLPAPESDVEEERVPTLPPTKKDKPTDSKKRIIEKEDDENDEAPAKKHKKEIKVKEGGKQKKEIVDERKKKKAKSKKEIESSGDETDKSDAPSELYTDDTSSTGNLSVTAKPTTAKTTEKSSRSESGSDHSKAKQKKNKSELKLQGFKDLVQDKNPKKTDNSALLLRESGLNKLKSLTSSKSSSKSSRSEDEPDSSDAGATAKAKSKPKGLDTSSAPQKDLSASSSSTVLATPSKPREEEQLKEQKEETGEKGAAPNNLFEKFLLNCEAKDRVPRKQAAHTPKSSVKPDKKARKESPVQKTEFDKAKEGTIAMEADERQEKSAQEAEKSDRSNEPVAKMKEDVQREQKEEEQRRRKERLEEEEEKKRKEKLEESQRERKGKMEEAQKERQRLAEDVRLDWLDRRPAVEAMASTESTEDLRWKERRRKRREDSESRLLVTCDDNQDSQDPLERSEKTPDRGPPSLNLGVELNLDWMTLEDFQKHLNGEDENLSPLSLTPTELRDAVKNGNYMAVKRALSSKEDYNLDQQAVDLIFGPVEEDSDEADHAEEEEEVSEEENITENDDFVPTEEEESSDEEEPPETGDIFQSKDGNILWSAIPPRNRRNILGAAQERSPRGPTKYAITRAVSIKSTFELFISEEIQKIVLVMTNKEGCRVYGDSWRKLDKIDLQGYLGLLILAGVYRSSKEVASSLWHAQTGRAIFCATMPLKTFNLISRVIRFDDHNTRSARRARDKLAAIRQVWDKWVCRLQRMYNPGTDVAVDKCLIPFKGRCGFKQYMANKPDSYGIKICVVCDSQTSYAWNMQVYTGKPVEGQPEKNLGQCVILEVTKGLQGHIITCDHYFTSYVLGQELLRRKLAMVGTIRKNKPELPPALLATRDRARLSSQFAFTDTHTLVSYCPKKRRNVLLMSTLHQDTKVDTTEDKKPQIILDYNKNKGGVDNLDKVTSVYSCKRLTAHWPITVFYKMLDVSAYNSFVLWREINPNWNQGKCHKRRLFLEELGRELVTPLIKRRQPLPRTPASASIVREIQKGASTSACLPKRRRCIFCTNGNKTSTRCQKCDVHICKSHSIITCQSCK